MTRYITAFFGTFAVAVALAADNWPQFRGPGGTANSSVTGLPEKWSDTENLRWKVALPGRGVSCPVIANGKVYLTASSGMTDTRLHVLCFDAKSGKKLWERQFWATGQTFCHPKTCMACPTPVTDGESVYCVFATGDAVALNSAGDVLWIRALNTDYPKMTNHVGRSQSPILHGDVVIVPMESQGDSFVFGLDTKTGQNRWKLNRTAEVNWTTPLIVEHDGQTDLLIAAMHGLSGHDPRTGQTKWTFEDEKCNMISSPLPAGGDVILVPVGFSGLAAMKLSSNAGPEVLWKSLKIGSGMSTPVVADGRVYSLGNRDSNVFCANLSDGKIIWDRRLQGPFSASPLAADGKLYLINEEGECTTFKLGGDKPEILGRSNLKDTILATPAIADGAIFIRSDKFLYCISAEGERG